MKLGRFLLVGGWTNPSEKYCWWTKSCTSWYGKYPIIYRVSYITVHVRWCGFSSINGISQIGLFPKVGMKIKIFETTTQIKIKPRDYWHIKRHFLLARVYFFNPHIVGLFQKNKPLFPIPSMYGIFTYIWLMFMVNVGKRCHTWMVWVPESISFQPYFKQIPTNQTGWPEMSVHHRWSLPATSRLWLRQQPACPPERRVRNHFLKGYFL